MKGLITIILLLSAASCITQKKCLQRFPPVVQTEIVTQVRDTIIYKDTTVFVTLPGNVIRDSVIIPCPEPTRPVRIDTARAETSLAEAKAWWSPPRIMLELIQKDTTIELRLENAIKESRHWRSEYEKVVETHVEKKIPTIYSIALGGWIGIIILLLIVIALKLGKIIKF